MSNSLLDAVEAPLPERLTERLAVAQSTAEANAELIEARFRPVALEFRQSLNALASEAGAKRVKLQKLLRLVDAFSVFTEGATACKKGCTHCCHIPVAMIQSEADALGTAIGRPAKKLSRSTSPAEKGYGYHMPCTFLKEGACSIYAHRPLSCRVHFNLDQDALLCELLPDRTVPVPLLDMRPYQIAYMSITPTDNLGDIRDFFPPQ